MAQPTCFGTIGAFCGLRDKLSHLGHKIPKMGVNRYF